MNCTSLQRRTGTKSYSGVLPGRFSMLIKRILTFSA